MTPRAQQEREGGTPGHQEVEIEAAQLVDGVVGAQAGVAQEQEGQELGGKLVVGGAVEDLGEDRQVGQRSRDGGFCQDDAQGEPRQQD